MGHNRHKSMRKLKDSKYNVTQRLFVNIRLKKPEENPVQAKTTPKSKKRLKRVRKPIDTE